MIYCVISHDDTKTSLHCIESDLGKSKYIYNVLFERFSGQNRRLLELLSLPDNYFSESGFNFFKGDKRTPEISILESNKI